MGVQTLAQATARSTAAAWALLLRARIGYGIGPFYFCLYSMARKPAREWREYLTYSEFEPALRKWNPPSMHTLVRDKLKFHERCVLQSLPIAPILGIVGHHSTDSKLAPSITTGAALSDALNDVSHDEFFMKPSGGAHGHGAFAIRRQADRYQYADREGSALDLFAFACSQITEGQWYLLQPRLRNHRALAGIMSPHGLGTVRIVTLLRGEKVSPLAACIRLTVGTNVTDNFSVGATGNLTSPVHVATGRLGPAIGSSTRHWPQMGHVAVHPDTQQRIEGFALPDWQSLLRLVDQGHRAFPELGAIGWDIALTDEGPTFLEANHFWDIQLLQVAHDHGFRTMLWELMGPW